MLTIYGGLGSPYSMKIRALCRYRRIPHIWTQVDDRHGQVFEHVKVPVIPIVAFPDGRWMNDSTPLAFALEAAFPNDRSVVPADEAQAFIGLLLEDFADEWITKVMFHYRWFANRDQVQLSHWLAYDRFAGSGADKIGDVARWFRSRQVERMPLVGCTAENAPLIIACYERVMALFEAHLPGQRYLFGTRPSLADFALLGQLSQLAIDPTPADLMRDRAPTLMRWLANLDDASGVEGAWSDQLTSPLVDGLLVMMGEVYMPFLLANVRALGEGAEQLAIDIWGHRYAQQPFKYQLRCLEALRVAYAGLSQEARERVDPVLQSSGLLSGLSTS
jgi:glutathione S-transferase